MSSLESYHSIIYNLYTNTTNTPIHLLRVSENGVHEFSCLLEIETGIYQHKKISLNYPNNAAQLCNIETFVKSVFLDLTFIDLTNKVFNDQ